MPLATDTSDLLVLSVYLSKYMWQLSVCHVDFEIGKCMVHLHMPCILADKSDMGFI